MKKIILTIIAVFTFITSARSQSISEIDLIGTWKVENISYLWKLTTEEEQQMKFLEEKFKKSQFDFQEDKHFYFNIDFKDLEIKNAHWKLDKTETTIIVQSWEDKNSDNIILMLVETIKEADKFFFIISETPLKLEMRKE